ncbi:hypothetical protein IFM89_038340 [Coptis chinensis]|uniref:RBR-type E3 ubiquitin transferase n=1 Tax=Coptis chinensis TaxID=261450 RepID=A0A835I8K7_9MAGN|nr:hypothetical protein IFM89_038340 [Coptis chinensis]
MDSEELSDDYMDSVEDFNNEEENVTEYDYGDDDVVEGGYPSDDDEFSHEDCGQNHTVLTEEEIKACQDEAITEVESVLSLPRDSAIVLLCEYNWRVSNVTDDWFADEDKVRKKVGLLVKPVVYYLPDKKINCRICFDDFCPRDMVSVACGHLFCKLCWKGYITTSINDGPGCLTLRCPEIKCPAIVGQDIVDKLVSGQEKKKYSRYLLRSYVEINTNVKWCPAPDCDNAVEFVAGSGSYDVSCNCKCNFCWNCLEETHRPVGCDTVATWILKNSAESENVTWILANSKPCPKCKRPIQKNAGCMHMTCTPPCKNEFCWLCLGSWETHGEATGGFYACNRYEKAKQEGEYDEEEKRREMAKSIIEKYTHYYERWEANHKSRTKAVADLHQAETVHINNIRDGHHESEVQVKFITEAWAQIIECRRVLKWTYAYGYYLPEDEPAKRQFFEYLQGDAEFWLERLHECAEKGLKRFLDAKEPEDYQEFRTKLINLTSVTKKYFANLVRALENDLADVDLGENCELQGGRSEEPASKSSVAGISQEVQAS